MAGGEIHPGALTGNTRSAAGGLCYLPPAVTDDVVTASAARQGEGRGDVAATPTNPERTGATGHDWLPAAVRLLTDRLADAMVAVDSSGRVVYANPSAEALLGWEVGTLAGRPLSVILPEATPAWLERFEELFHHPGSPLTGERLDVAVVGRDGATIRVDLVLSVMDHLGDRPGGRVVFGTLRLRRDHQLRRWSLVTQQLLDALTAPSDEPPAERLLATLGDRLDWDVTTLWGLEPDGTLVCRAVWTRQDQPALAFLSEKRRDPTSGSDGLPRWVVEHGEPKWAADLSLENQLVTPASIVDGLHSACAFPVRYRGQLVGAVKMMSRDRRERDPDLVDLMGAVTGQVGEILRALEEAEQRDRLVEALEETTRRHEFLLRASRVLSETAGYVETLDRLAVVAVPALGDLCLIDVIDEQGEARRLVARHADPARQGLADELRTRYPPDPRGSHPAVDVLRHGRSRWASEMSEDFLRATSRGDHHLAILRQLQFTSYMTVPLTVGGTVRGTVTLVSAGSGRRYSAKDLSAVEELADQIASVVERARLHDRDHRISHTLQHSLLPDRLPEIPGLALAGRYLPAADYAEVGGDWYDVVPLEGGGAGLVVGDVQGHYMEAASIMGRLRHALSLVLSEGATPGEALTRLNRFLLATDVEHIATVLVATLDPSSGTLRLASAGHPSPVLAGITGAASLAVAPGPPLGIPGAAFPEMAVAMGAATLVLFTDGLVERRDRHPDDMFDALLASVARSPGLEPWFLVDHVLSEMRADDDSGDDVAVLAVRRLSPP
jgi:PAS domain S-box-containing protein